MSLANDADLYNHVLAFFDGDADSYNLLHEFFLGKDAGTSITKNEDESNEVDENDKAEQDEEINTSEEILDKFLDDNEIQDVQAKRDAEDVKVSSCQNVKTDENDEEVKDESNDDEIVKIDEDENIEDSVNCVNYRDILFILIPQ